MEVCEKMGLAEFRANSTFKPTQDSDSLFPVEYFWHGEGIHPRLEKVPPYTDSEYAGSMTVITQGVAVRILKNRKVVTEAPELQWYDPNGYVIPSSSTRFVLLIALGEMLKAELFYDNYAMASRHMDHLMSFSGRRSCSIMDYESYKRTKNT